MMYYYGPGMNGWAMALMILSNAVFWALIIIASVAVFRHVKAGKTASGSDGMSAPRHILAQRFARGEIDADQYARGVLVLNGIAGNVVAGSHSD